MKYSNLQSSLEFFLFFLFFKHDYQKNRLWWLAYPINYGIMIVTQETENLVLPVCIEAPTARVEYKYFLLFL